VGNGAFVLQEWTTNKVIRVTKSPTYWDCDRVQLNEVAFFPIETVAEEVAFRAGQLHLTSGIPVVKVSSYRSDPQRAPLLHEYQILRTSYFRFNCTQPPFRDVRVRRALSLAVDRASLARNVMQCDLPAWSLTPPNCDGYTAERTVITDLAEARQLLAAAGYPGGRDFPKVEVFFSNDSTYTLVAEAVQQMWWANLGINVGLTKQEVKVASDTLRQMRFQIFLWGWIGDYLDPTTFLDLLESSNGNNQTGWANVEYDRLLREAASTVEPTKRHEILRRAEALMLAEAPITPLYHQPAFTLVRPNVQGWHGNFLDVHPLKFITLGGVK
jgi:oligopeptide transport system substrate-binding protein